MKCKTIFFQGFGRVIFGHCELIQEFESEVAMLYLGFLWLLRKIILTTQRYFIFLFLGLNKILINFYSFKSIYIYIYIYIYKCMYVCIYQCSIFSF